MRFLALLLAFSGCTRLHAVTPDANGGVYFVAQKQTLGISGRQTLIFCATADTCGTVISSNEVSELGPTPTHVSNPSDALSDVIGGILGADEEDYARILGGLLDSGPGDSAGLGELLSDGSNDWVNPTRVDCPNDAVILDSPIPSGTRVSLIAIHQDDAYSGSEFEADLPITGTVDGDLHVNEDCWAGGGFDADSGDSFYFYKAAFRFE